MSGSFTSSTTRSIGSRSTRRSASVPVSASTTVYPDRRSQLAITYRFDGVSSTISTVPLMPAPGE
ncbi:MAG: hypothetical protein AUI10_09805 [Actinobacteria bacterium 13_2_20CM_2_72_6]|nr:MAG: hypothetical protein AUI10_09805 [Actinobacteria bacterium 13_2_20CM_2_72_6]